MVKNIRPTQTIGIIGGGQLGRMMAISAKQMGFKIASLDPTSNSPLGQMADIEIVAQYDDQEAAKELLNQSDVVTFEFENIDVTVLELIESSGKLPQGSSIIKITQDRAFEKDAIAKSGVQVAPYRVIENFEQLKEACSQLGFPVVVKTRTGGYDGKGQLTLKNTDDLVKAKNLVNEHLCIVEKFISFEKEISVVVSRSILGEVMTFPVSENIHKDHILIQSIVPARIPEQIAENAEKLAKKIVESINVVGTLAVEMFLTSDGDIYINELAPRPHNSGHYTMDACMTSQFEQHIRAITGFKLASTKLLHPVIMMNVLGEHYEKVIEKVPQYEHAKLHLYGKKDVKTKRKMGHVNFLTNDISHGLKEIAAMNIWRD